MAPAVVVDVTRQAAADADYVLTAADVRTWEARNGEVAAGAVVLLRTGWSARWPDRKHYLGDDTPGDASKLHFPAYGKEAAELLVKTPRWRPSVSIPPASTTGRRRTSSFTRSRAPRRAALENVASLAELPRARCLVVRSR